MFIISTKKNNVSSLSKRDIFDVLYEGILSEDFYYYGKLTEINFLNRIFDLDHLPSTDGRFDNMTKDIWQHTINNYDWEPNWLFDDERLKLKYDNENFIEFIEQIFHPSVIDKDSEWEYYLSMINNILLYDKLKLDPIEEFEGRSVYKIIPAHNSSLLSSYGEGIKMKFNSEYIDSQISIMLKSIESNPNLAIGKAKELLESCAKTILDELEEQYDDTMKFVPLIKLVSEKLNLTADSQDKNNEAGKISAKLLGNMSAIPQSMAELRNLYGDGHGKTKSFVSLPPRYARLAVGTAVTMVYFLWETFEERKTNF